jgi:CHRD domain
MRKLGLIAVAGAGAALVISGVSLAQGRDDDDDRGRTSATLDGYQETPSISTEARGSFRATIENDRITFQLRYTGLEGGNATVAHLHLGQRHTAGGVSAFLCGGGGQSACPSGASATIEGAITAANVIGPGGQGIAATELDELVAAIRVGAVYANVHNQTYPMGEIRGQLRGGRNGNDED